MATKIVYSLSSLNRILKGATYRDVRFFILLDENSYNNCIPLLISRVSALETAEFLEVPAGEECKSLEIATQLWQVLLESNVDRNTVIINLGGGCVSDLGGFIAAGFKRGLRFINVPTTLVGMIDASIGGKTGVNLSGCKNQIGFFHNPDVICIEPAFLDTLPEREMKSGLFEMLKTFLISDPVQYKQCLGQIIKGDVSLSDEIIQSCAIVKSAVVKQDPKERSIRKILNFGHTFGHGIESFSVNSKHPLTHGESVGIGMACALYLSVMKLNLDKSVLDDYVVALKSMFPIPNLSLKDCEAILSYMHHDKKNADGLILCVLLQEIGVPIIDVIIDDNEIRDALLHLAKL